MKLSVIIACLNGAKTIPCQLDALVNQHYSEPWEVIVSDNGSTDGSQAIVASYKTRLTNLRMVDASQRPGAYHARNVGALVAWGDALVFCDADDEVAPGWLSAMGEALSQHDFIACRVDFTKHNPPWSQEIFKNHAQQQGRLQKAWYPPYLSHAGGGTLGVKKFLHDAVGGFDESLPHHGDTDYCFRIQLAGSQLRFVPEAVLHIRCRGTLGGLFHQARRWAFYSLVIYKRYRPPDCSERWRWWGYAKRWKKILLSIPQIRSKTGRAAWLWQCGWHIGLLQGSIMNRVPPV